ncbi:hypothetical protein [Streptomyces xanthophaeus]
MAGTASVEERLERLKALLTGQSGSARTVRALGTGGEYGNLLLGVALHAADGKRQGRSLTDLEGLMADALGTVMDEAELKEWGRAYRETVQDAPAGTLVVPQVIAELPAAAGFAISDLEKILPELSAEVAAAPNVCLLSLEDLATGRQAEDPAFIEGMRECGFAVTGIARRPGTTSAARSAGAEGSGTWRVRLEMDKFYVQRAVGDQGGGKDELYFTASSSAGGSGQTFISEDFGSVERGQNHYFEESNKVFLDEDAGPAGLAITSIQVWEADQSNSRWYRELQKALNRAVETIDAVLDTPGGIIADPVPFPVSVAYEVAKIFISLMDALRNDDDLSHQATFVLTREDMAVLHHRPEMMWHFNGDGYHKLTVRYTGGRPVWPVGRIEIISREHGATPAEMGPWSAPMPLGWHTRATPALTVYRGHLYTVFPRAGDDRVVWSRYDGKAWTIPAPIGDITSGQPCALAVFQDRLQWLATGMDGRIYHAWFNGQAWTPIQPVSNWASPFGPSMSLIDGNLWSAHTGQDSRVYASRYGGPWRTVERVGWDNLDSNLLAGSGPALGTHGDRLALSYRSSRDTIHMWHRENEKWEGGTGIHGWATRQAPFMHRAGQFEWLAHAGMNGYPNLGWREAGSWYYSSPAELIKHGSWTCTALGTPALTTHNDRRLYAIYHA